ncbi:hypothetical protein [Faecalicatena contorta]|uniref:hypothetical protein n=1 Tax=Faecalicatena contorta TaxID=39482 RepID=UPI001F2E6F9C|nr:hypothetical protein [Faecalicatena contorta]MCF2681966.1 hypothetical protein [Faecalicatena contorta]
MDLIIEDEYVNEVGNYLKVEAEDIEKKLKEYISILKGVCEEGIVEGKTAEALKEFVSQAEAMKGIAECGRAANTYCKNFISRIDEADEDLY